MKFLFNTDPHGAQTLFQTEPEDNGKVGNRLYTLRDNAGAREIIMTGEELQSLAAQFGKLTK